MLLWRALDEGRQMSLIPDLEMSGDFLVPGTEARVALDRITDAFERRKIDVTPLTASSIAYDAPSFRFVRGGDPFAMAPTGSITVSQQGADTRVEWRGSFSRFLIVCALSGIPFFFLVRQGAPGLGDVKLVGLMVLTLVANCAIARFTLPRFLKRAARKP
jgi:hypothetical protein